MEKFERVSFVIPYADSDDLKKPATSFNVIDLPSEIAMTLAIGFVGLLPNHRYYMHVGIIPVHLAAEEPTSHYLVAGSTKLRTMYIDTKSGSSLGLVDGHLNVNMNNVKIVKLGIYRVLCRLTDSDDSRTELHSMETYFTIESE